MGNHLEFASSQGLHHMLTNSPWDHGELFKVIRKKALALVGQQRKRTYLIIDEVGFRKKGNHSACVGQQYIGSIGKNDNGQVAVTAAVSCSDFYCPLSMELVIPQQWDEDEQRRVKAGIPPGKRHEKKGVMAMRMIRKFWRTMGKKAECVVFDALYGYNIEFLYQLMIRKIPFVGDVRGKFSVYLTKPKMRVPKQTSSGPRFVKKHPNKKPILIHQYASSLLATDFKLLTVRQGTKGTIQARYHMRKVWMLYEPLNSLMEFHLLIRKDSNGDMKYSLGSFSGKVTLLRLARAQAQRAFIERVFEEGKNIVGLADYQTRSWNGFHRHMALCSLSLLFLMEQKIKLQKSTGRVSAYFIQELVCATINSLSTLDQVIKRLLHHIPQYQRQIQNHLKRVT